MSAASVAIPFAIGEALWWTGHGVIEHAETCPECCGDRVLTVILGNGEAYEVACEGCKAGYEPSRGYVKRIERAHVPTPFVAGRVSVDGERVNYSEAPPDATAYRTAPAEDLFRSEAECAARCAEMNATRNAHEREQDIRNLQSKRRDLAWSVHYWRGQRNTLRRQLLSIESRLVECEARKPARVNKGGAK